MKKYLYSCKQRADYNEGAMESEDHFKNGANPKSLMSRGKLNNNFAYQMHK
ncbi:MAG: hypothetical protein LBM08_10130 [Dysgonamonadaceae bacterium]|jgi:hypothetical protein|nr:hypothetical protein [Dysgonamonadaceae bacterium]